ncbi:hypothetical protein AB0I72_26770 [Nocardiopsis sp. NPDC049922]|uniref:phage terminase small subunit n=1 Tax=Nocardiopsis sp. NPDC049922 TaxID=3155157 RepID=UPI0034086B2F
MSEDATPKAPKLFKRASYSTAVHRWWDTWAESPQAELFLSSDWERLQMLAPLVQAYWEEPKTSILAEIRLNEERLGATIRDRQSLRMTLKSPQEDDDDQEYDAANDAPVVDMELYRELGGGGA